VHILNPDILGFAAALFSTGSLAPQVYKTWRSRSAGDFSYVWLFTALTGAALWGAYGLARSDWAIVAANATGGALILSLIVMKRQYSSGSV
jgi:MtN3 and saliva related transmembrane protein